MGLHRAWYALARAGVYRLTEAGFGPTARRITRTIQPVHEEYRCAARVTKLRHLPTMRPAGGWRQARLVTSSPAGAAR
ncbi:hypothetical protein [Streptomyces sp. NPDC056244]|uniref:hypothetical protein n=1 Tax=Streptomyces sp. NPDC056244 TaxID=3345762 RepID=UPI0035DCBC51